MLLGNQKSWSLRRRLLLRMLLILGVLWVVNACFVLYSSRHETAEEFDDSLSRSADLLLAFAEHEYTEGGDLSNIASSEVLPMGRLLYQIFDAKGRLLMQSIDAPQKPLSTVMEGFQDIQHAGKSWRLVSMWNPSHTVHLLAAESTAHRSEIMLDMLLALLLPMLLGLPILIFLVWAAINHGLQPTYNTSQALIARADDDFSPVSLHLFPKELQPLLQAFNTLFARLSRVLENEKRFTADAAHELRTPLAAIRLQAQLVERAQSAPEAQLALTRLIAGVDRATKLVDQLLTLARLDPRHAADQDLQFFMLPRVVEETLSEFESSAHQRKQQFKLDVAPQRIRSSPQAVYVVLRNLIENALRYSPDGSVILIEVAVQDQQLIISVSDQGSGIAADQREKVLERFARLQNDNSGSGLGLFIVNRITQSLAGSMHIGDSPTLGGAKMSVQWPLQG